MLSRSPSLALTGLLTLALYGCPDDAETDAGFPDATVVDTPDAGFPDAEPAEDAGFPDAEPIDMGTPDTGVDAGTPQSITFLHTNDEHSHFLGFAPNVDDFPTLSTSPSITGGIYRRATVLRDLEIEATAAGDPVVTVSAGDVAMGSLFHIANLISSPDYIMQGILQYDALTLGNHEFDFGPGVLAEMIENGSLSATGSMQQLRIPLVVSNIRFSMDSPDDDALAALWGDDKPIRRTWMRRFGEVNVGFVGVVGLDAALVAPFKTPVNFSLANDGTACTGNADCASGVCLPPADNPVATSGSCAINPGGDDFAAHMPAMIADIASAVADVRAAGADIVVAISHSGVDEREIATLEAMGMGLENAVASEEIVLAVGVDAALTAADVPGIDLIIGGHSHSALQSPLVIPNARSGIDTHIVQAGQYGQWVGKVRFERDDVTLPWQLDTDETGLTAVDGTVRTDNADTFFIDAVLFQVMDALEQLPIASANDGTIFPGEQCDRTSGGALVAIDNGACSAVIPGATGTVDCHMNRQLDLSTCTLPPEKRVCGDNQPQGSEQCDGTTIPVACTDLGYTGGTIGCATNCTLDVSGCTVRFPSLLEAALNFELPTDESPIIFDGNRGDLFFHQLGTTGFDVGGRAVSNESNILNLVADANRAMSNQLADLGQEPPVEVSIVANGLVRDGVFAGQTGALTTADLFRVVPLGVSPQENTPGYTLIDFYLSVPELKAVFEIGVSTGLLSDAFWLGTSGARVEYDLSLPAFDPANPTTTGRVTRIEVIAEGEDWSDTDAAYNTLFDADADGGPTFRLVHMSTDLYIGLFAGAFGICPRNEFGAPHPQCAPCSSDAQCTVPGGSCNLTSGTCTGGEPPAFSLRTTVHIGGGLQQELKEFLALMAYVRRMPGDALHTSYQQAVPRRMCCVGTDCPADNSRTCPVRPQ